MTWDTHTDHMILMVHRFDTAFPVRTCHTWVLPMDRHIHIDQSVVYRCHVQYNFQDMF